MTVADGGVLDSALATLATLGTDQARRIARALLDEVALTRRAAQLRAGADADRVTQFSARLADVTMRSGDALVIIGGESAWLLHALNSAAAQDGPRLGREVTGQLGTLLDGELRGAAPVEIGRQGSERLGGLAAAAAEAWWQQQREAIEQGLDRLEERLTASLHAELEGLRSAAAELLGLDLAVPEPEGRLAGGRSFFDPATAGTAPAGRLADAIRRDLPGELSPGAARDYLCGQAPVLVSTQIDRARDDLREHLAEASRELTRAIRQRYADATSRLTAALQAAAGLGEAPAAQAEAIERKLTAREAAVRQVLAQLDQPGHGGRPATR